MNWDAIGAIAEMLAAFGVIISLIFVGVQVRKGSAESRAATKQATTDTEIHMVSTFARYPEIWNKVQTGQPLADVVETRQAILLFNMLMIDYENRYHQYQAGYFDDLSWQNRVSILRTIVDFPIFELWRESPGGQSRSADWLDFLDKLAAEMRGEA